MLFIRWLVLLLLLVAAGFFAMNVATGQPRYRRIGLAILQWTLVAAFVFFAVLIVERLR